jgi:CRP-like cAMP-binding protein
MTVHEIMRFIDFRRASRNARLNMRYSQLGRSSGGIAMTAEYDGRKDHNRLLSALTPSDFALLAPHLKSSHLKQGVVLQESGDPIAQVYFPYSGMISLLAVMAAGNGVETATIGREGAVGVMVGFGGRSATGRAVIQLEGVFATIDMGPFERALGQSAPMRSLFARYNDAQITLVYQVAGCNALHQVSARLCRWLLQTRDRGDSDIISLTHEFLSEMLGVQRTTVTMLAKELQDVGLINYRRGRIEIVDRRRLEARACECYETARRKIDKVFSEPVL